MNAQRGFTIVEVLVASLLLGISTVSITGLAVLGSRSSVESERQNKATALVNERLEVIRSLPYESIGFTQIETFNEPGGVLEKQTTAQAGQQEFTVNTEIQLIDDPQNGSSHASVLNERTADYKKVRVTAAWTTSSGNERDVTATTLIAPAGAPQECVPGAKGVCPGIDSPGAGACIPNADCTAAGLCPSPDDSSGSCPPGSQYCLECYSDDDCDAGFTCEADTGSCVDTPGACRTTADCSGAQVCSSGFCEDPCSVDSDCSTGEICNPDTGICTLPCTGDQCTCPAGTTCNTTTELCFTPTPPPPTPTPSATPTPTGSVQPTPTGSVQPTPTISVSQTPAPTVSGTLPPPTSTLSPSDSSTPAPPPVEESCYSYVTYDGFLVEVCEDACGNTACEVGYSCVGGTCEPDWCLGLGTTCDSTTPIDPGCGDGSTCLSGRWVTYPTDQEVDDPICGTYTTCSYSHRWESCLGECSTPSPTISSTPEPTSPVLSGTPEPTGTPQPTSPILSGTPEPQPTSTTDIPCVQDLDCPQNYVCVAGSCEHNGLCSNASPNCPPGESCCAHPDTGHGFCSTVCGY